MSQNENSGLLLFLTLQSSYYERLKLVIVLQNAEVGILSKQTIFRETRHGPAASGAGVAFQLRANPNTRTPTHPD